MPDGYLLSLALVAGIALGSRLVLRGVPLKRLAVPVGVSGVMALVVGLAGLALHCGSMFFRSGVESVPGLSPVAGEIDALGAASIAWYVASAGLVVAGLRRQWPPALAVLVLALGAVGVTMYDRGPLVPHLSAIFVAVVVLVVVIAVLVGRPSRAPAAAGPGLR